MVKKAATGLCLILLLGLIISISVWAQEKTLVRLGDARGDDVGGGALLYPQHLVYVPGLFDLTQFQLSEDDSYLYFDFQLAALTNPFGAPEGYFHQRLEVCITAEADTGHTEIPIGRYILHTSPGLGWHYRLSVAPFDESRLYVADGQVVRVFSDGVHSRGLPEQETIRVQVQRELLPQVDPTWGYYVLVGSFDGLAEGFWRDLGEGLWQVGGEGVPVFDLLAPRLGGRTQKRQLREGVLFPVYPGRMKSVPYLLGAFGIGMVIVSVFLWRWRHDRTYDG